MIVLGIASNLSHDDRIFDHRPPQGVKQSQLMPLSFNVECPMAGQSGFVLPKWYKSSFETVGSGDPLP